MADEIENGQIKSTHLGEGGHRIFTFMLDIEFGESSGQGFGGYALDGWQESAQRRVGTAIGMDIIKGVMRAVGVEKWEDLKGSYCRVKRDESRMIRAIGHITDNKWFDMRDIKQA